jgi:hypothetical protein
MLAEGLIMADVMIQFRDNLENIYDLWVPMVQKFTLLSTMASDDPCIGQALRDLVQESEAAPVLLIIW